MYPFYPSYPYHRYPYSCSYRYGCARPYWPVYGPQYNALNSQIAYTNQSMYNSGYMAGVTQSSIVNNIGGYGGLFL